ncbi:MAG: hypothetical protein RL275_3234 [Chloroflexota bacterium]
MARAGEPCPYIMALNKTLERLHSQLNSKIEKDKTAAGVEETEERSGHPLATPGNETCNEEAPKDSTTQEAGEEGGEMDRLRCPCDGSENGCSQSRPENDVHWIAKGEKCSAGKIPTRGIGICSIGGVFSFTRIFDGIESQFDHQCDSDDAQNCLGDIVLNDECQPGECDRCPGGVTNQ